MRKVIAATALSVTLIGATAGFGGSVSVSTGSSDDQDKSTGSSVDPDKLTSKISDWASARIGDDFDSVSCGDLKGDKGSTGTCTVKEKDGDSFDLKVEVTDDSGDVHFSNDQLAAIDATTLQQKVTTALQEMKGQAPPPVTCPEEGLIAELHATQRCTMTDSTSTYGMTVTVDQMPSPTDYHLAIQVDSQPTSAPSS